MTRLVDFDEVGGEPIVILAEHVSAVTSIGLDQSCVHLIGGQSLNVHGTVPDVSRQVWPQQKSDWER